MPASYPSGFDTLSDPGAGLNGPPLHSTMHHQINDILEAIETELGIDPSGADASIAATLTALPTRYAPVSLGKVFYAQTATNVTTAGTGQVILAGLSTTGLWTAVAGRRYRLTCQMELTQSVATDVYVMNLINQTVPVNLNRVTGSNASTAALTLAFTYVTNASISGAQDWRVGVVRAVGTGTIDISGTTTPAFMLIEDVGPIP